MGLHAGFRQGCTDSLDAVPDQIRGDAEAAACRSLLGARVASARHFMIYKEWILVEKWARRSAKIENLSSKCVEKSLNAQKLLAELMWSGA